jgi:putative salt-induced outer membrane protein YdiY
VSAGVLLAVGLTLGASLGYPQTPPTVTNEPPPAVKPWQTTAAVGLTLTRGNSETLLATLSLESKRDWDHNQAIFGVAGGYGEDKSIKNTEFLNGFGQYNRLFSDRFYAGMRVDATYDGIAGLDYRVRVTPLAGYYLIKTTNTLLSVEAGPSAVFEKQRDQSEDTYLGVRFGERFEQKLSAAARLWETVDYVPQVDKWAQNYVVTFETGVDTAINKHWSLRVLFQDIYTSDPAAGRERNDLRLVAGTAYKF